MTFNGFQAPESQFIKPSGVKISGKTKFKTYQYIADERPQQVVRQRYPVIVSGNKATVHVQPFMSNLLLSSKAYIKWVFSVTKKKNAAPPVDENFGYEQGGPVGENLIMKPFMCMANAAKSVKLSINGKGIVYSEPRYWQKYMGQLFCPGVYNDKYMSTAGSHFPNSEGAYDIITGAFLGANGALNDNSLNIAADAAFQNYADIAAAGATTNVEFYEPLYVGCFNWAYDFKDNMDTWHKNMSNLIPYVRSIDYSVEYDKLAANSFYYLFGVSSAANFEQVEITDNGLVSAELVLEWIKPQHVEVVHRPLGIDKPDTQIYANMEGISSDQYSFSSILPSEVRLQTWYFDHRQFPLIPLSPNPPPFLIDGISTTLSIPEIHMYQVPSYILMFVERDKDHVNYKCAAVNSGDGTVGNNNQDRNVNSIENNAEITSLNIQINVDKNRIDNRYNSRELYNLTLKNARSDYPYEYTKYIGGLGRQASYPSNMVVLLTPDDLNIDTTTGRFTTDFMFKADITVLPKTGHWETGTGIGALYSYNFHLMFIYDKHYMKIDNRGNVDFRYESEF